MTIAKNNTEGIWQLLECVLWWGSTLVRMFVFPQPPLKSHIGSLIPKGDGINRWGLWEVIRS